MHKLEHTTRVGNSDLLRCIGASLRQAMQDIAREELPESIHLLLSRLDGLNRGLEGKAGSPTKTRPPE